MARLRLHETLRYPKPAGTVVTAAGYRDFFELTRWPDWPGLASAGRAQLERGIDSVTSVMAVDGERRPVILIGVNPHKAGSDWTPWHDEIDPRNGFVRYFGDNKPGLQQDPLRTPGNRALVSQQSLHASPNPGDRLRAAPLLFFENVIQLGRSKGYRRFRGVGLLDRVERVIQMDKHGTPFLNYRYDCTLIRLADDNNELDWQWIAARRDPTKTAIEAAAYAPKGWKKWLAVGGTSVESIRQRLLTYQILAEAEQRPDPGSPLAAVLATIMVFYGASKHRFEALAERIAQSALARSGSYRPGWLTRGSGDRGIDFVGRLDLGPSAGPLRVVVAGQAKCLKGTTGVAELSRLASKLNRGWVGVFVTTGHFSVPAQRELQDDGYPILLLHGRLVAEIVHREASQMGKPILEYLQVVDASYEGRIRAREPGEILSDE